MRRLRPWLEQTAHDIAKDLHRHKNGRFRLGETLHKSKFVIPAQAGNPRKSMNWIPASVGMTNFDLFGISLKRFRFEYAHGAA
jgi:hypothetical protein